MVALYVYLADMQQLMRTAAVLYASSLAERDEWLAAIKGVIMDLKPIGYGDHHRLVEGTLHYAALANDHQLAQRILDSPGTQLMPVVIDLEPRDNDICTCARECAQFAHCDLKGQSGGARWQALTRSMSRTRTGRRPCTLPRSPVAPLSLHCWWQGVHLGTRFMMTRAVRPSLSLR